MKSTTIHRQKLIYLVYPLPVLSMDPVNDPSGTTDQKLLDYLRTGNEQAWRKVYNDNRPKVVNYLRRRGASEDVALEIYQDTLVFLDEKKHQLELTSKLSVYLTGVAYHKLQEYWKKQATNENRTTRLDTGSNRPLPMDGEADDAELALLQLAWDDNAFAGFDTDEPDVLMQKALTQITLRNCVDIFQLHYWENLDYKEIASLLKLSYGTVRNQVIDCKKQLKEILMSMGWDQ